MDLQAAYRATRQWVPFTSRTIGYGTVSLTLGPLTRDHRASLWAMKRWCASAARGLDIDVVSEGTDRLPDGPFVYCSNHQSLLDILVLGSVLPGDYKWAAKRELMKVPFVGWHLRLAGHVPVDRGRASAAQVVSRFVEVLGRGKPLLVFPEGTRSEDGVLKAFKSGGFAAAVRAGVPVVPVALDGTYRLLQKGAIYIGDGSVSTIKVVVGAPIHPGGHGDEDARVADLRDRTYDAIADQLRAIGGDAPERKPANAPSREGAAA